MNDTHTGPSASPTAVLQLDSTDIVRGGTTILEGVDLSVGAGEHWALIGANGAGKSTLLSLCGAVEHPTRGTVRVLGHQLGRVDIRELRAHIGHVNPRHPLTSPLTVREVVLTGHTGTIEWKPRWVPDAEALARADHLIEVLGLGPIAASTWPVLSQGERGRALIARALVADPALLLLDEPSTGLDVAAREQFLGTLDDLHRSQPQLATVLVTHHLEELPASTTHAALLRRGRLQTAGPGDQVLTTELISECFDYPIIIDHREGRWSARAGARAVAV